MNKYTALVRETRNGNLKSIISEYKNKKDFYEDLKGNGFRVIIILSEENIKHIKGTSIMDLPTSLPLLVIEYVKHEIK